MNENNKTQIVGITLTVLGALGHFVFQPLYDKYEDSVSRIALFICFAIMILGFGISLGANLSNSKKFWEFWK